jgi:hypothetical protein
MALSNAPVVEKAQHDPHCPWFLTGVTIYYPVLQSIESRIGPPTEIILGSPIVVKFVINILSTNYWSVISANIVIPNLYVCLVSTLCFWMTSRLVLKTDRRY